MTKKQTTQNVKVGLFVAFALAVLTMTVFVIGQERSMFTRKTKLYTSFADINGLVVGAPVRLAGVDVGRVTKISFSDDLARSQATVELSVENEFVARVRKDSRAYIDSKGLLGDKLINLSVGSPSKPQLADGDFVEPKASLSLEAMARDLEETAASIGRAAKTAETALKDLASPEVTDNLRRITGSLAAILEGVEQSDSVVHRLVYDEKYADQVEGILDNLEATSEHAESASARVDNIVARVEQGPGTLHALAYGEQGVAALSELQRAAANIAELTAALNRGEGLGGALLRGDEGKQLVHDMSQLTARINRMSVEVERGRGTLGGLLVDPSVYEDMKTVLGNIERNKVFKALVRMTIKQGDIRRPTKPATLSPKKSPADAP